VLAKQQRTTAAFALRPSSNGRVARDHDRINRQPCFGFVELRHHHVADGGLIGRGLGGLPKCCGEEQQREACDACDRLGLSHKVPLKWR
jgi:hypothetical protein